MSTTIQADAALADALSAAAEKFPIADLERMPAEAVTDVAANFPDGGGRWVAATFEGDRSGAVAVVVSFDVASGLFDTEGNAPKLEAVVAAAASALGVTPSDATTGRGPDDLPMPGSHATTCALALHSAGEHVVTLFVCVVDELATDGAGAASFPQLGDAPAAHPAESHRTIAPSVDVRALKVIRSVEMSVTAELGRSSMTVRELLELSPGSVIELDRAAGSPVDLLVNGTIIARGEVVVIDEEYGIRISEIIGSPEDL